MKLDSHMKTFKFTSKRLKPVTRVRINIYIFFYLALTLLAITQNVAYMHFLSQPFPTQFAGQFFTDKTQTVFIYCPNDQKRWGTCPIFSKQESCHRAQVAQHTCCEKLGIKIFQWLSNQSLTLWPSWSCLNLRQTGSSLNRELSATNCLFILYSTLDQSSKHPSQFCCMGVSTRCLNKTVSSKISSLSFSFGRSSSSISNLKGSSATGCREKKNHVNHSGKEKK